MSKEKICGIYKIFNILNNKVWVGESVGIYTRWRLHRYQFSKNKNSGHLQNAWNKYGKQNFQFEIIEECTIEKLKEREEYWIEYYKSYDPEYGYNIERISNGVKVVSEETKKKISKIHKGKKVSLEVRKRMSESRSGEKHPMYGKKHSVESRLKMINSHVGKQSGENNPNCQLSWEIVKEIRNIYKDYIYSYQELANKYGVKRAAIYKIVKNITWKEYV